MTETTQSPGGNGTTPDPDQAQEALRRAGVTDARFDDYTRHLFARDASMYAIEPLGVVFPRDADEVAAVTGVANELGVTLTPRGAGTSLAGQTVGPGLIVDMSRHMSAIKELDPERRTARVQPGVVQDQLNAAAAPHGLMFGPDTSTSNRATLGGMIGNNSAGSGSMRHGMTIDHVRSLDVVLADGQRTVFRDFSAQEHAELAGRAGLEGSIHRELDRIIRAHPEAIANDYPDFWRRACGYRLDRLSQGPGFDLAQFVVGSEGTLALATEAEVVLVPKPKRTVIAVGHFATMPGAIAATQDALSCEPSAVEMMDRTILDLSRQRIEYASLGDILQGDPEALLFVSFSGDDEAELVDRLDTLIELWRRNGHGYHTLRAVTPEQQSSLLKVRKSSLGLLMAAGSGTRRPLAFVEDTAVDPGHLVEYTTRFKQILDEHDMEAGFYGHCSVGCLHIRPFVDLGVPGEAERMRAVAEQIKDLVTEYGGVNSSEHGDGLARSEFNEQIFGPELYSAMREVKRAFDPQNLLNPGKIVDAPAMTENLRDAQLPEPGPLRTKLSFEVVGGMRGAADRCMNIGLCRKSTSGTMCPSYIATQDEEHATRGRANALVKALSEPDPAAAMGSERLHEVLDLCLMCKACKSECPLGVDMAKLKSETQSHYHDVHGITLRTRIFGAVRTLYRLGSATAPLSTLPNRLPFLRRLMEKATGITARRPLPTFRRKNLMRWFRGRVPRTGEAPLGELVFLADSFSSYTEPGIGRAAIELLERAGWRVRLESRGCCGRSSLSKGLVDEAKAKVDALVGFLGEGRSAGAPIVGCEPSCVLTLKDEVSSLLPGDPRVADVAGRVHQVEELLTDAIDTGRITLSDQAWPAHRRILFHGHCHQKAEVGTAATVDLLRRIPGAQVVELDAGCCGMAGSFGFEAEHYEMSMKVGRDRLFPAIEAEEGRTVIAATGVSCRQQIDHGTQRAAHHPVELIAAVLDPHSATRAG